MENEPVWFFACVKNEVLDRIRRQAVIEPNFLATRVVIVAVEAAWFVAAEPALVGLCHCNQNECKIEKEKRMEISNKNVVNRILIQLWNNHVMFAALPLFCIIMSIKFARMGVYLNLFFMYMFVGLKRRVFP